MAMGLRVREGAFFILQGKREFLSLRPLRTEFTKDTANLCYGRLMHSGESDDDDDAEEEEEEEEEEEDHDHDGVDASHGGGVRWCQ